MNNKVLDIISKSIAIFTSLLIFLGIVSSVVYYRAFSINILDQITIGEALLLFVSKFSAFAICAIFGIFISRLYFISPSKIDIEKDTNKEQSQQPRLTIGQKIYSIVVIIPLFLLSNLGFSPFVFWTLPVSLIIRVYVLYYIIKQLRLIFRYRNLDSRIVDYIQIAGISLILVATIAMCEAYLVYTRQTGREITLHYVTGKIIKSNPTTLYLGKTQSFFYFYDKLHNQAIILKADDIDKVQITTVP